jgi:hypothetical protein
LLVPRKHEKKIENKKNRGRPCQKLSLKTNLSPLGYHLS